MFTPKSSGLLCVILCCIFFSTSYSQSTKTGNFTFTLSTQSRTSAGVYKTDSTLVRTLWSDSVLAAGTYTRYWDGKDDFGNAISSPDATYNIRVLSNNVNYTWDGVIGNTSTNKTGSGVHKGYYTSMTGMAITGTTAFFCQGYSEGYSSQAKFNINNPQVRLDLTGFGSRQSTANIDFVATDGTNVYWTGYNAYDVSVSFVFATAVSNDAQVSFGANGTSYTVTSLTNGKTYTSVIDLISLNANAHPTGLAVSSAYLFVSHGGTNEIHVLNKTTGALAQTITTLSNPRGLAVDGSSLWIVSGTNTVAKYTINANGSLSAATLTLSGITTPGAIAVKTGEISVIDAGTIQIVRFFNTSTGAATTTLGTSGGYFTDATVTNTKFFFDDYRGNKFGFLAYAPDGSFWVGDVGNYRQLHFSAGKSYIEYIMSLGSTYQVFVDPNNATRVFAGGLAAGGIVEFAIDYSQPLTGSTGWTLTKNWGAVVANNNNYHKSIKYPVTFSSGRTFAFIRNSSNGNNAIGGPTQEIVELPSTGQVRFTGITQSGLLSADGARQDITGANIGGTSTIGRYAFIGFNGSNNPLWSSTREVLATISNIGVNDPYASGISNNVLTSSDKVIWWNPRIYAANGSTVDTGYHLGAMLRGGNTFKFKTEIGTHVNYTGAYPEAGSFEVGNGVNDNAGGTVSTIDNYIFTSYHGEFWKNGQTNYFNHYDQYGLAIGQFGTDFYLTGGGANAAAGSAGNALTPMVVKNASGNIYMYHGDESDHAGVHRWSITNLSSIAVQTINIPFPSAYVAPVLGYVDLHAGLPFDAGLPTSAGWSKSGIVSSNTSKKKYANDGSPDVYSAFIQSTGTAAVNRDLGTNNVTSSWKISGFVTFEGSDYTSGSKINSYVDVLDNAGKILARFYYNYVSPNLTLYGNTTTISSAPSQTLLNSLQPLEIKCVGGVFTFTYATYAPVTATIFDATANWKTPKTLRQYWTANGTPAYTKWMGFMDMRLYTDYITAANVPPVANAGADTTIALPANSCALKGTGVDTDGTIANYSWSKISGPPGGSIVSSSNSTTTVVSLSQGLYKFGLQVTDNKGATDVDTMQITVYPPANLPPVANAGPDKKIILPVNITSLAGSGGDADGYITNYLWTKISGPAAYNIVNASSPVTDISGLVQGVYGLQLEVTDNNGATARDTLLVIVLAAANIPPVAVAGQDLSITLPVSTVTLNGSGSDSDGSVVKYLWKKISGPSSFILTDSSKSSTQVTNLIAGIYKFHLEVIDNNGASSFDTVQVTVFPIKNIAPSADAGLDQVLVLPKNKFDLVGSGNDPDGAIASYFWTQVSGPSAVIASTNLPSTPVSALLQGTYAFELKVIDNKGAFGRDTMVLTVVAAALPLKLLSFTGTHLDDDVMLRWETANEKKVSGFQVERMTGNKWETIAFVKASLANVFTNHYSLLDSLVQIGINYYRLKIVDIDGQFVYSNIISFERNPTRNLIYQNYPNPFSTVTNIKVELAEKTLVKIIVYNSGGTEVAILIDEVKEPGLYLVTWNAQNIAAGTYYYQVITAEDNLITKKMMKLY